MEPGIKGHEAAKAGGQKAQAQAEDLGRRQILLPKKLVPVFAGPALYRGAYGGRGSAKSRSFATMAAVHGIRCAEANESGLIVCGREYMNSLEDSSFAEVKAAIESQPWIAAHYDVGEKYIRTRDRKIDFAFVGLRHNLSSIKSKSRIRLLWVDEAEPVTETAWQTAIPTVREDEAEIWVTWNPQSPKSATHKRFRDNPSSDAKIVELNWRDNPWFPKTLDKIRRDDLEQRPDYYDHIWEGQFATVVEGAYFARELTEARAKNRIGHLERDPLMTIRAYWDIGGTGAKADACAIWICQFVGREIRVLDHYEAVGQPLATHVQWLRDNGYDRALCVLPHDGVNHDKVYDITYEGALRAAGFPVEVVPNQGTGAAKLRIEALRRLFPSIWFNAERCEAGMAAVGSYHEKRDKERDIGLGPEHDWASHSSDALGLMAVHYEKPREESSRREKRPLRGLV